MNSNENIDLKMQPYIKPKQQAFDSQNSHALQQQSAPMKNFHQSSNIPKDIMATTFKPNEQNQLQKPLEKDHCWANQFTKEKSNEYQSSLLIQSIQQTPPVNKKISIYSNCVDKDIEFREFQVVIHKINSRESIQDDQNQNKILFTKSELQIPIDFQESPLNQQQTNKPYVNIWHKNNQNEDNIYLKMIQQNQDKKNTQTNCQLKKFSDQSSSSNPIKLAQNVPINHKINKIQKKKYPLNPLKPVQKSSSIIPIKTENIPKQCGPKNTKFMIKKLSENSFSNFIVDSLKFKSNGHQRGILQNISEVYNLNSNNQSRQFEKKHRSKFESADNSFRKIEQNFEYEMLVKNQLQKMNQILEDRCPNYLEPTNQKLKLSYLKEKESIRERSTINSNMNLLNRVKKVIKKSPYGILELQLKDNKNQAKVTNLRILKPQQVIRLKKLPSLIKKDLHR